MSGEELTFSLKDLEDFRKEFEHDKLLSSLNIGEMNITQNDDGMGEKLDQLMHSDTMVLVVGLLAMIVLGLMFRSLCLRLSRDNSRKQLMREGLKQIAGHMDMVTRSMSNDLELPNSPKTVMRTYSGRCNIGETLPEKRDSLRELAFSNNLKTEMEQVENNVNKKKAALEKRDSLKLIMSVGNKEMLCEPEKESKNTDKGLANSKDGKDKNMSELLKRGDSLRDIAFSNSIIQNKSKQIHEDNEMSEVLSQRDSLREIAFCSGLNPHS